MKSRIAITLMLGVGMLMSTAGAGLAVSGISGDGSASQLQYPVEGTQGQEVLGESGQGGQGGGGEAAGQLGETAQAAEQVAVTGDGSGLAFTGFVAIPLLLIGVGLAVTGVVLRRTASA